MAIDPSMALGGPEWNVGGVGTIDSSHLCFLRGIRPHVVESPPHNMKITKPMDYYVFRALYEAMENEQIMG